MNLYELFLGIVAVSFGILQLVLMFKLLSMTRDVWMIKEFLLRKEGRRGNRAFAINDLVVRKEDKKQMRIIGVENGKYVCASGNGLIPEGEYAASEIELLK